MAFASTGNQDNYRYSSPIVFQTFPLFSKLPPELRLKIWEYNLPSPRLVSVRCGARSPSSSPKLSLSTIAQKSTPGSRDILSSPPSLSSHSSASTPGWYTSSAPIPVNLHVCHESRVEALRRYALMFGIARQPGNVYFDAERDVLYFGPREGYMAGDAQLRTLLLLADPDELALVRRIALSEAVFGDALLPSSSASSRFNADQVATSLVADVLDQLRIRLPSLGELVIVPHGQDPSCSANAAALVPLPLPPLLAASQPFSWLSSGSPGPPSACSYCQQQNQNHHHYDLEPIVFTGSSSTASYRSSLEAANATTATTAASVPLSTAAIATSRLARQVHTAMHRVCSATPSWAPPQWRILAIRSEPEQQRHGGGGGKAEYEQVGEMGRGGGGLVKQSRRSRHGNKRLGKHKENARTKTHGRVSSSSLAPSTCCDYESRSSSSASVLSAYTKYVPCWGCRPASSSSCSACPPRR